MIEVLNLTSKKSLGKFLFDVASLAVKLISQEDSDLSIVLVGEQRIKKINKKYRRKDKTTDVLSFSFLEGTGKTKISGEIFLCPNYIYKQAKKLDNQPDEQLTRVMVHGILHLAGMDHEKDAKESEKMFRWQEEVTKKILKRTNL